MRENKPVLLGIATKDGLSDNAENIGKLLNYKNIYFIPYVQSNPITKPTSLCFLPALILKAIEQALEYQQIQPIIN